MNKYWIIIFALLLVIPAVQGKVIFNKKMPSAVEVSNTFNISMDFKSTENINAFDIVEFIPLGWEISSWKVYNYNNNSVVLESESSYKYQGKERTAYHWSFKNGLSNSQVVLVYTIMAKDAGSKEFITVWTYPNGFETSTATMSVLPGEGVIFCGNNICELGENSHTCPQDCPKIKVEVKDITPILVAIVISLAIITIIYLYITYLKKILKQKTAINDLSRYIKLGLQKGYKLKEMINALKNEGINTEMVEGIVKKNGLEKLETGKAKMYPEEKIIQKIKKVIENLSEEDIDSIYNELEIKKIKRD